MVQPDVLIASALTKPDERGMRGSPDWLAEIRSRATASHDQTVKLPVDERAGVLQVWFVHPTGRMVSIDRLVGGRYGSPTLLTRMGRTALSAIPRGGDRLGPRPARDHLVLRSAIAGREATAAVPAGARVRGARNGEARFPAGPRSGRLSGLERQARSPRGPREAVEPRGPLLISEGRGYKSSLGGDL